MKEIPYTVGRMLIKRILYSLNRESSIQEQLTTKSILSRKFYIRWNNNKVAFIETGCIVIAHLLP